MKNVSTTVMTLRLLLLLRCLFQKSIDLCSLILLGFFRYFPFQIRVPLPRWMLITYRWFGHRTVFVVLRMTRKKSSRIREKKWLLFELFFGTTIQLLWKECADSQESWNLILSQEQWSSVMTNSSSQIALTSSYFEVHLCFHLAAIFSHLHSK